MAGVFTSCQERIGNPNRHLLLGDYRYIDSSAFALNSHAIRRSIDQIIAEDKDRTTADNRTKGYYRSRGDFLWIDRKGIDSRADTLLAFLREVGRIGFSPKKFCVPEIEADLKHVRTLDFDTASNRINQVMARLEYHLTKAYLRYSMGQRYGFLNPVAVFNRLDVRDSDSVRVNYVRLFDLDMELPDKSAYDAALCKIHVDSIGAFLRSVQPRHPMYVRLSRLLNHPDSMKMVRSKIMANMERYRWRLKDRPELHSKCVVVNIPSFHLDAYDGEEHLMMRIGCGALETKTPLLTSRIKRMDINPQWVIPRSIIQKSIVPHVGNIQYFDQHRYFVRERRTGKVVDVAEVTPSMLLSGDYSVVQEGGEGNALGRIIFRFDNEFSIYLHDTSSRAFFARDNRGVSHGCVRVENPYDLAVFMLQNKDQMTMDKIRYSMTADVSGLGHGALRNAGKTEDAAPDTLNRRMLLGSVAVTPQVPVFITYHTIVSDRQGHLMQYQDVYGYDRVINQCLTPYQ